MSAVLITGANRGIGLEMVQQFLNHKQPPKVLIATCRAPEKAADLNALARRTSSLYVIRLDVDQTESFPKLVEKVTAIVGEKGLNVLINNAGVAMGKVHRFEDVTPEQFLKTFQTNTVGPVFLTQALLPLIRKAASANKNLPMSLQRAAVVNVSSILGSVSMNQGGYWAYRETKAALNQASRSLAAAVKDDGILVTVLHPGWVRTDMGGPEATLGVEESTAGLVQVLYSLDSSKHDKLIQWDGAELSW